MAELHRSLPAGVDIHIRKITITENSNIRSRWRQAVLFLTLHKLYLEFGPTLQGNLFDEIINGIAKRPHYRKHTGEAQAQAEAIEILLIVRNDREAVSLRSRASAYQMRPIPEPSKSSIFTRHLEG